MRQTNDGGAAERYAGGQQRRAIQRKGQSEQDTACSRQTARLPQRGISRTRRSPIRFASPHSPSRPADRSRKTICMFAFVLLSLELYRNQETSHAATDNR